MNVGPSSSPEEVFTAPFSGIYAFVLVLSEATAGTLRRADDTVAGVSGPAGTQGFGVFYLNASEALTYEGGEAFLAGVRLGNEL